jgi:allantoate deiminase
MRQAGLVVTEDAAGNIFGTLAGKKPGAIRFISGSHLDTVRNGGAFDGTAGIVCALETARLLQDRNIHPDCTYELAAFAGEEGTRFGQVLLGSKIVTGSLGKDSLDTIHDDKGMTLRRVLAEYHNRYDIETACRRDDAVFFEIHIEQGPVLENGNFETGIVESIQGVCWLKLTFDGNAGHAGAHPMNGRKDAGIAAYTLILNATDFVKGKYPENAAITVGRMELFPGSSNVIPGRCTFTFDIRGTKSEIMNDIFCFITEQVHHLNDEREFSVVMETISRNEPVYMDRALVMSLEKAVKKGGYSYKIMNSGAGHDAMELASIWKTAMLFLPSTGGVSHHPDEFTPFVFLEKGAIVLRNVLLDFSGEWPAT